MNAPYALKQAAIGTLVGFHVSEKNTLTLQLEADGVRFTRRINLNREDAGLHTYDPWESEETLGFFAYGRQSKPQAETCDDGSERAYYPLDRSFAIYADVRLLRRIAQLTWGHTGFPHIVPVDDAA